MAAQAAQAGRPARREQAAAAARRARLMSIVMMLGARLSGVALSKPALLVALKPAAQAQARRALSAAAAGDAVPAALVKELRERTGSPMMECKKALADPEVKGDLKLAAEWLRRQGVKMAG